MSASHVQLVETPWIVARQAPLSMEISRQEYWNGLPFPPPADLPDPGIKPGSPTLQADPLLTEPLGKPTSWGIRSAYCHLRVKLLSLLFSQLTDGLTCSGILSSPILSDNPSLGSRFPESPSS